MDDEDEDDDKIVWIPFKHGLMPIKTPGKLGMPHGIKTWHFVVAMVIWVLLWLLLWLATILV